MKNFVFNRDTNKIVDLLLRLFDSTALITTQKQPNNIKMNFASINVPCQLSLKMILVKQKQKTAEEIKEEKIKTRIAVRIATRRKKQCENTSRNLQHSTATLLAPRAHEIHRPSRNASKFEPLSRLHLPRLSRPCSPYPTLFVSLSCTFTAHRSVLF